MNYIFSLLVLLFILNIVYHIYVHILYVYIHVYIYIYLYNIILLKKLIYKNKKGTWYKFSPNCVCVRACVYVCACVLQPDCKLSQPIIIIIIVIIITRKCYRIGRANANST